MLDPNVIVTGAAGNIVASMVMGSAAVARAKVAQLFRHGTAEEQQLVLEEHERDALALTQWVRAAEADPDAAAHLEEFRAQLTRDWTNRLKAYLVEHPDARRDFEAVASTGAVTNKGRQSNTGSGTFVNGTVLGGIHNSFSGGGDD